MNRCILQSKIWNITQQVNEQTGQIVASPSQSGEQPKTFTFDTVFAPECKQVDLYNQCARPIVDKVLEGYNGMLYKNAIINISNIIVT